MPTPPSSDLSPSIRRKILAYINSGAPPSVKEVSQEVAITEALAKEHLGALLHEGVLVKERQGFVTYFKKAPRVRNKPQSAPAEEGHEPSDVKRPRSPGRK